MNKHKIIRDTFFLTAIELILQGLSLLLNVFVTRKLGSSFMGMISLIGSFFGFVTIISSGNIYLSSSRFISEEIGKKNGNPNKVFRYSVVSSVTLSIVIGIIVFSFSELISTRILKTDQLIVPIRILAMILPVASINSSLKGYFNAVRNVSVAAAGSTLEFLVKSGLFAFFAEFMILNGKINTLTAFAVSIAAGQIVSCLVLVFFILNCISRADVNAQYVFKSLLFHLFRFFSTVSLPLF